MTQNKRLLYTFSLFALAIAPATGCNEDDPLEGNASLSVRIEAEDVITKGIPAGMATAQIRDGWSATFSKYLATVGNFSAAYATMPGAVAKDPRVHIVDLANVSTNGAELWKLNGISDGRWEVYYHTPVATANAIVHPSVSPADAMSMVTQSLTYWIEGEITNPNGQSCPPKAHAIPGNKMSNSKMSGPNPCYDAPKVQFKIGVMAPTHFGPCEIEGSSGVALVQNVTQTVSVTLHGDHLFFNGFPEGHEGGVLRLAQWLADCDLNLDGVVTNDELQKINTTDLPVIDKRYNLGASPIKINNMLDYVVAQAKTQGHFQGEGGCAVDGKAHKHGDHGHDHDHNHDHHDH